jgi:FixJ family two-component response regulator
LVSDVVMPAMNGPQLAGALVKSHPETKHLFMSGYTDSAIIRNGILDAGRAFLQKPFSQMDLAQSVRGVLDQKGEDAG